MKRNWTRHEALRLGVASLLAIFGLAGCNGGNDQKTPEAGTASQGKTADAVKPATAGKKTIRVGLVLDTGGVDDKSFNAAAKAGLDKAKAELHLSDADARMVESRDASVYKQNLSAFASQGFDVVFAVGYKMEDAMKEVAAQFPNVKFAVVDGSAPAGAANCSALQFREEQGTFLAGYLAASVSKTHTIGFVGGEKGALIGKFEAGRGLIG